MCQWCAALPETADETNACEEQDEPGDELSIAAPMIGAREVSHGALSDDLEARLANSDSQCKQFLWRDFVSRLISTVKFECVSRDRLRIVLFLWQSIIRAECSGTTTLKHESLEVLGNVVETKASNDDSDFTFGSNFHCGHLNI